MRLLAIGDVFGAPGRNAVRELLPRIKRELQPDFIIANAENSAHGFGITRKAAEDLFNAGIDVLTGGNHIFDNAEVYQFIDKERRLVRPANYPPQTPGIGWTVQTVGAKGLQIAVISLMGRAFMTAHLDCPIRTLESILKEIPADIYLRVVDFHGEATSEKQIIARYFDGALSLFWGTHTHVVTADECVLPLGTAYISDIGMTGVAESVLGMRIDLATERMLTSRPLRLEPADGKATLHGIIVEINETNGRGESIQRIKY